MFVILQYCPFFRNVFKYSCRPRLDIPDAIAQCHGVFPSKSCTCDNMENGPPPLGIDLAGVSIRKMKRCTERSFAMM